MLGEQTAPGGAGHGLKGSRDGGQRLFVLQGGALARAGGGCLHQPLVMREVSGCPAPAGWAAAPARSKESPAGELPPAPPAPGWAGDTPQDKWQGATGHWEIACLAEAAGLAHLCPS